jgi:hypothetical protein
MAITMKAARLLSLSVFAFGYVMLTGFDSSVTETGDKLPAADSTGVMDVTDLEKPPNLAVPLKEDKTPAVATEPRLTTNRTHAATKPPLQLKRRTAKKTRDSSLPKAIKDTDSQGLLDLSIPFKENNGDSLSREQNSDPQNQKPTLFTQDTKKKSQSIRLDGNVLMSQEPEAEKRKTVDGAGITLNLKP